MDELSDAVETVVCERDTVELELADAGRRRPIVGVERTARTFAGATIVRVSASGERSHRA